MFALFIFHKGRPTIRACPGRIYTVHSTRVLRSSASLRLRASVKPSLDDQASVRKPISPAWQLTMSAEERARKLEAIERSRNEEKPRGLVARLKFYIKRYWYMAIPVHMTCCGLWFVALYLLVRSEIDVIALLEMLHMPDAVVEKLKNVPETAGYLVVAFVLYNIATPIRYPFSLVAIQLTFRLLRRCGWLRTARELEFSMRARYEELNKRRVAAATHLIKRDEDMQVKRVGKPPSTK